MTYPPQQPGPGGTQPPYGQQYSPPGPGYGQPQQFGTPQYGTMPPNSFQQAQFPPPYGQPPKKRSPLPWVIGGVGVLVVVVGVLLWVFLGSGSGTVSANDEAKVEALGKDYGDRLAALDFTGASELICSDSPARDQIKQMGALVENLGVSSTRLPISFEVSDVEVDGDTATLTMSGSTAGENFPMPGRAKKLNGSWCLVS